MKYTVHDLERMRQAIYFLSFRKVGECAARGAEKDVVERELLTYMVNETTPDELDSAASDHALKIGFTYFPYR